MPCATTARVVPEAGPSKQSETDAYTALFKELAFAKHVCKTTSNTTAWVTTAYHQPWGQSARLVLVLGAVASRLRGSELRISRIVRQQSFSLASAGIGGRLSGRIHTSHKVGFLL